MRLTAVASRRTVPFLVAAVVATLSLAPGLLAQGVVEAGAITGAVGAGAAGGASGVGGATARGMAGAAEAIGGVNGGGGGGETSSVFRPNKTSSSRSTGGAFSGGTSLVQAAPSDAAWATEYLINFDGSLGPLATTTMGFDELRAFRRRKAEKMAWTNGAYGTADYVPRRQRSLDRVVQQAKSMQYSQRMVDDIANAFRLQDYVDYDYDVRYGKDVEGGRAREQARILAERRRAAWQSAQTQADLKRGDIMWQGQGDSGVKPDEKAPEFGGGSGVIKDPNAPGQGTSPFGAVDDAGRIGQGYDAISRMVDKRFGETSEELPPDVVASLEASVHNAVLERLRAKGFNVAALNVFLQSVREVKVIVIITTSELPQSAIRATLRQVRAVIENEVLKPKFPSLALAQLSSFTILNEVDNHFYEHPVLYWQMQGDGWTAAGREVTPGAPAPGERLPRAKPGPEADELLNEFLGVSGVGEGN